MQTEDNLRFVVADVFEQLVRDNVLYAEIRFAPLLHTQQGLKPAQVVEIIDDAVDKGVERTDVEARLILCTLRHFSVHQSLETVHLVRQFLGRRVVALILPLMKLDFPLMRTFSRFSMPSATTSLELHTQAKLAGRRVSGKHCDISNRRESATAFAVSKTRS